MASDWDINRYNEVIRGQHFRSAGAVIVGFVLGVALTMVCFFFGMNARVSKLETKVDHAISLNFEKVSE